MLPARLPSCDLRVCHRLGLSQVLFDLPDFMIVSAYTLLAVVWAEAFLQVIESPVTVVAVAFLLPLRMPRAVLIDRERR